jgi:hypothetical protein
MNKFQRRVQPKCCVNGPAQIQPLGERESIVEWVPERSGMLADPVSGTSRDVASGAIATLNRHQLQSHPAGARGTQAGISQGQPAGDQISSRRCHSAGMYRANLLTAFDTADFDRRRGEVNVFTCS